MKPDSSDPEPEGLTLLVPDIQKTAEIVYAATTSLRQANQGAFTLRHSQCGRPDSPLALSLARLAGASRWAVGSAKTQTSPRPSSLSALTALLWRNQCF